MFNANAKTVNKKIDKKNFSQKKKLIKIENKNFSK
jgi:hypothetical protein